MRRRRARSGGQALVLTTISITVLFGLLGLVVDLGWAYYRQEAAQSAADAAVLAATQAVSTSGATSLTCGTGIVWCGTPAGTAANCPSTAPTTMTTVYDNACAMAAQNGFVTTGSQQVSIQANTSTSAPTAPGATVSYWVTARVSETPTRFFGTFLGSALNVTVRATAGILSSSSGNGCIYVLDPKASPAFTASNGADITTGCGIYVNSNGTAATPTGEAMLVTSTVTVTSGTINVNGSVLQNNGGVINGTIDQNLGTSISDPLVNLPTPQVGTCLPASAGNMSSWQSTPYTPSAGTYCNGFSLSNGNSAIMGPGIYIIDGGTFSIQSGPLTANGGVMIFLTNGATVNIANGSSVTLSAETTGTYQGILFYSDRNYTPGASTIAGGATMNLSGSLYFPTSLLNFNNGSTTSGATMAIIADTVNFEGGADIKASTSTSQTGLSATKFTVAQIE